MGLGEQQGKRDERMDRCAGGEQQEKKVEEGSEKSLGKLEEVRVDRPSALPRVCIVGTGTFGRQGASF